MPPVGFKPTISAGERPKTYALDRAATGTDISEAVYLPNSSHKLCHSNELTQCGRGDKHFEDEHCEICVLHSNTKGDIHSKIHVPRSCQN